MSFYKKIKRIIANLWGYTNRNKNSKPAPEAISHTTSPLLCNSPVIYGNALAFMHWYDHNKEEKYPKGPFQYQYFELRCQNPQSDEPPEEDTALFEALFDK